MISTKDYQRLASRTECDQRAASQRRNRFDSANTLPGGSNIPPLLATRLSHACIGIAGEAGELCGLLEKWLQYGQDLNRTKFKDELGDCMWYIALACNALGLDLGDVMESNIRKLQVRYPDKYTSERAMEEGRDQEAETRAVNTSLAEPGRETPNT